MSSTTNTSVLSDLLYAGQLNRILYIFSTHSIHFRDAPFVGNLITFSILSVISEILRCDSLERV
jgi:hypothetical protein